MWWDRPGGVANRIALKVTQKVLVLKVLTSKIFEQRSPLAKVTLKEDDPGSCTQECMMWKDCWIP